MTTGSGVLWTGRDLLIRQEADMTMRYLLPFPWTRNDSHQLQRAPFNALRQEMNRLFENFGNFPATQGQSLTPKLDVSETDKEVLIDADLPGIDEKDIEITLAGDMLTIHGERKNDSETKDKNYHVTERSWGSFDRQIELSFEADPQKVSAKFDKGVLHIAIPKPEEIAAKTAKIPISSS